MDDENLDVILPSPLKRLQDEDLEGHSVDELEHRITVLTAEIERSRTVIDAKRKSRGAAEAFFRKS